MAAVPLPPPTRRRLLQPPPVISSPSRGKKDKALPATPTTNGGSAAKPWLRASPNNSPPTDFAERFSSPNVVNKFMNLGERLVANVGGMYRASHQAAQRSSSLRASNPTDAALNMILASTSAEEQQSPPPVTISRRSLSAADEVPLVYCGVTLRLHHPFSTQLSSFFRAVQAYLLARLRGISSPSGILITEQSSCVEITATAAHILARAETCRLYKMDKRGTWRPFVAAEQDRFNRGGGSGPLGPLAPLAKSDVALLLFDELAAITCDEAVPYVSFQGASLLGVCTALRLVENITVDMGHSLEQQPIVVERSARSVQEFYGRGLTLLLGRQQALRWCMLTVAAAAGAAVSFRNLQTAGALVALAVILFVYPVASSSIERVLQPGVLLNRSGVEPYPWVGDDAAETKARFRAFLRHCAPDLQQEKIECALHPAVREIFTSSDRAVLPGLEILKAALAIGLAALLFQSRVTLITAFYRSTATLVGAGKSHMQATAVCAMAVLGSTLCRHLLWPIARNYFVTSRREGALVQLAVYVTLGFACLPFYSAPLLETGEMAGGALAGGAMGHGAAMGDGFAVRDGALIFETAVAMRAFRRLSQQRRGSRFFRNLAEDVALSTAVDVAIMAFCPYFPRLPFLMAAYFGLLEPSTALNSSCEDERSLPLEQLLYGAERQQDALQMRGPKNLAQFHEELIDLALAFLGLTFVAVAFAADTRVILLLLLARQAAAWIKLPASGLPVAAADGGEADGGQAAVVPPPQSQTTASSVARDAAASATVARTTVAGGRELNRFLGVWRVDLRESSTMDDVSRMMGTSWAIRKAFAKFTPSCKYERPEGDLLRITSYLPFNISRSTELRLTGEEYVVEDKDIGSWRTRAWQEEDRIMCTRVRVTDGLHLTETRSVQTRAVEPDGTPQLQADKLLYSVECRATAQGPVGARANRLFDRISPAPPKALMPWTSDESCTTAASEIAGRNDEEDALPGGRIRLIQSLDELLPATPNGD